MFLYSVSQFCSKYRKVDLMGTAEISPKLDDVRHFSVNPDHSPPTFSSCHVSMSNRHDGVTGSYARANNYSVTDAKCLPFNSRKTEVSVYYLKQ